MTTSAELIPALLFQALPAHELHRIRRAGVDDHGHDLRVFVNHEDAGVSLRCCLREARVGERIALLAWRPLDDAPGSVYAEVGPVFVHADDCPGYTDDRRYPEGFRHRQQVLHSYTEAGDMLDTVITDGRNAEAAISALLAAPDAVVVHSRNVQAGCYMFAIRHR